MTADLPRSPARVRDTYDRIASHFAVTRDAPWPEVEAFLDEVDGGALGLDVGCGNGRHVPGLRSVADRVLGLDISRNLLEEARERVGEREAVGFVLGDATSIPLPDDSVDVGLSIATVHHLPDRETRVASLGELGRVLDPRGTALVSVWSTVHDRFDVDPAAETGLDTTVDWTLPGGETVPRYYHIYAPAEFRSDLQRAGLTVASYAVSSGNCYARLRS